GRRPFSLRGLALAATILVLVAPEAVMGVSFQMSFAAVLALIAGYEALRPALARAAAARTLWRRIGTEALFLALTSLLAGGASAPFAAYHFGRFQPYFVFANVLAVPLTAFWVMPFGLLALALMPLGLGALALVPMGWGVAGLILLARTVAAWPAATLAVPPMPGWGLVLVGFGMVWLGLWRRSHRLLGLLPLALGLASPLLTRPPDILVSPRARLIAFRAPDGVVWRQRLGGSSKFVREEWRRVLGGAPARAFPRDGSAPGLACAGGACRLRGKRGGPPALLLLKGAAAPARCRGFALVVSASPLRGSCRADAPALIDRFTVWRDGAAAAWLGSRPARVVTDRSARGARPWVPPPPVPRARGRSPAHAHPVRRRARRPAPPAAAPRWPMARTD
ncbi:MAG: ComEC/Rec2 family competence protein, partial [Acetobacteraceae bacterium]